MSTTATTPAVTPAASPSVVSEVLAAAGPVLAVIVKSVAPSAQQYAPQIGEWIAAHAFGVANDPASVADLTAAMAGNIKAAGTVAAALATKL